MLQIAHRGSSQKYGDNNMISFHQAIKEGFQMIELDILLCASGEIVIHHDTFFKNEYIDKIPYHELKPHGILLLEDFFSEFAEKEILIYLDLKGSSHKLIYPLFRIIKKWFSENNYKKLYISAFDRHFTEHMCHFEKFLKNGLHIGFTTENTFTVEQVEPLIKNCTFFCVHWTALDKEMVDYLHEKNILVFAYTCKDEFILNHMIQYKLDGIVSNYYIQDNYLHV